MRSLKKLLAVVVAICVLATFTVPAFAAESFTYETQAQTLNDLGLYAGTSTSTFNPDLGTALNRETGIVLFLRLFGLEKAALALTDAEVDTALAGYTDAATISSWAKKQIAYAVSNKLVAGMTTTTVGPKGALSGTMFAALILRQLGYADAAYATSTTTLSEKGGLTAAEATLFASKTMIKDDLVGMAYGALLAKDSAGKTVIANLVAGGTVTAAAAVAAGLVPAAPVNVTVSSVSADNLKQVVVAFNGAVDKDSAEKKDNYSMDGFAFESASLAADGKTVTVTLAKTDDPRFVNQKEYKITVDGVKDASGKSIAKADKVAFTPVDTTIPTVKEVTALGTKALKIVFTEPVIGSTAATTAAYKIDGKSIAGSVKYNFTDSVIITTTMTTGEHKLSIDGVTDYAPFKVSAKDIAFTVAEDTTAPEIVSAKAIDLKKVEVIFNEPVKALSKAYHTNSNKTTDGPAAIDDKKVTLTFTDGNKMSIGNTTVTLENVEDYSGNKATRTVDVTPVLDMERPTVTAVKAEKDGSNHKFTVTFSESVLTADAEKGANYVFKDKDAKVVTGKGLNSKGSPASSSLDYNNDKKQVTFSTVGLLGAGDYTLEISGIQDSAFVANMMMPYTYSFTLGDTSAPTVKKAWAETTPVSGKYDSAIFVRFSEDMATEGNGNVLDRSKYNYSVDSAAHWKVFPSDTTLEMVTSDTLKITLPRSDTEDLQALQATLDKVQLRITLVSDVDGNFLASGATENYIQLVSLAVKGAITINSAKATAKDTISVEFAGVLTNIDAGDFEVTTTHASVTLESYTIKDGNTTAIFKLADADKLPSNVGSANFKEIDSLAADVATQDAFGIKVTPGDSEPITDEIRPESIDYATDKSFSVVKDISAGTYQVNVKFDENMSITAGVFDLIYVKIDGTEAYIDAMRIVNGNELQLDLLVPAEDGLTPGTAITVADTNSIFEVGIKDANDTAKVFVDGNNNAAVSFDRSQIASDIITFVP